MYNSLKLMTLAAFERRGWLNPPTVSQLTGYRPVRAVYSYLLKLHRWGLLLRQRDDRGLLLYRLSDRGRDRLAWLKRT